MIKLIKINVGREKYIHRSDVVNVFGAAMRMEFQHLSDFHPLYNKKMRKKAEIYNYKQLSSFLNKIQEDLANVNKKNISNVLVFPELTVPIYYCDPHSKESVYTILKKFCQKHNIVIICGCFYELCNPLDINLNNKFKNFAKIFIPGSEGEEPLIFEHVKGYPSKYEYDDLTYIEEAYREDFKENLWKSDFVQIFKNTPIGDFAVFICSDYEQAHLLDEFRGEIDVLFIIQANLDQDTYVFRGTSYSRHYYYYQFFLNIRSFKLIYDQKPNTLGYEACIGPFKRKKGMVIPFYSDNEFFRQIHPNDPEDFLIKCDLKLNLLRTKIFGTMSYTRDYYSLNDKKYEKFEYCDPRIKRIVLYPEWLNRLFTLLEFHKNSKKQDISMFCDQAVSKAKARRDVITELMFKAFKSQLKVSNSIFKFNIDNVNSIKLRTMKKYEQVIEHLGYNQLNFTRLNNFEQNSHMKFIDINNYSLASLMYCLSTTRLVDVPKSFKEIEKVYKGAVEILGQTCNLLDKEEIHEKFRNEIEELFNLSDNEITYSFIKRFMRFIPDFKVQLEKEDDIVTFLKEKIYHFFNEYTILLKGYQAYYSRRFEELKLESNVYQYYNRLRNREYEKTIFNQIVGMCELLDFDIFQREFLPNEEKCKELSDCLAKPKKLITEFNKNKDLKFKNQLQELNQSLKNLGQNNYDIAIQYFEEIGAIYNIYLCELQDFKRERTILVAKCHQHLFRKRIREFLKINKKIYNKWEEIAEHREVRVGDRKARNHDQFYRIIYRIFGREIRFLSLIAPYMLESLIFYQREIKFQLIFYNTVMDPKVVYCNLKRFLEKAYGIVEKILKDLERIEKIFSGMKNSLADFIRKNSSLYRKFKSIILCYLNTDENIEKYLQEALIDGMKNLFTFDDKISIKYFTLIWISININDELQRFEKLHKYKLLVKALMYFCHAKLNFKVIDISLQKIKNLCNEVPEDLENTRSIIKWLYNLLLLFKKSKSYHLDVTASVDKLDALEQDMQMLYIMGEEFRNYSYQDLLGFDGYFDKLDKAHIEKLESIIKVYLEIQSINRFGWANWKKASLYLYKTDYKNEIEILLFKAKECFQSAKDKSNIEFKIEHKRRIMLLDIEILKSRLFSIDPIRENFEDLKNKILDLCENLVDNSLIQGNIIFYLESFLLKRVFSHIFSWVDLLNCDTLDILNLKIEEEEKKTQNVLEFIKQFDIRGEMLRNYLKYHTESILRPLNKVMNSTKLLIEYMKSSNKCEKIKIKELENISDSLIKKSSCFKRVEIFDEQSIILQDYIALMLKECELANEMERIDLKKKENWETYKNNIFDKCNDIKEVINNIKSQKLAYDFISKYSVSVDVLEQFNDLLITIATPSLVFSEKRIKKSLDKLNRYIDEEPEKLKKYHIKFYQEIEESVKKIKKIQDEEQLISTMIDLKIKNLDKCILEGILLYFSSFLLIQVGRNSKKE